jgi:ubiquinone/menaquinone biosynthesis C-methylase UbiE
MHWQEIDTLLEYFVTIFSDIEHWKIADIGCGNGRLLRHIIDSDLRNDFMGHSLFYVGLDSSQVLLDQGKIDTKIQKYFSPEFLYGDMRDIGILN